MVISKGVAATSCPVVRCMMANGSRTAVTAMVHAVGLMVMSMKELGKMIFLTVKVA